MNWSKTPIWLKAVIVAGVILLILWVLNQIDKHVKSTRSDLKDKLHKTQIELQALIAEKRYIQGLIKKVQNYVDWTLRALKLFLVFVFGGFTLCLVHFYSMDIFTAIGTAGTFVGTIYMILVWLLKSKINNLRQLEEEVTKTVQQFYYKQFKVVPAKLVAVDEQIILLERRTKEIQLKLNE